MTLIFQMMMMLMMMCVVFGSMIVVIGESLKDRNNSVACMSFIGRDRTFSEC